MGNSCSPGFRWWCLSFCAVIFPLDVLDEIWDVIESVSEGYLTYSLVPVKPVYLPRPLRPVLLLRFHMLYV